MATAHRVFAPMASPSICLFRFASPASSALKPCQHVFRTFSSSQSSRSSSKRKMQTSTYQSYPLPQPPLPPPRNTGVPETSIAGSPQETRPPKEAGLYDFNTNSPAVEKSNISITEQEAQQPKVNTANTQPKAKPRTRLRARKAAMTLTPGAVEQLKARLDQPSPKLIKIGVRNRGCSGLAYDLEFVDKPGMFDEVVEQDGVKVVVDSKALLSILGTEMDWEEDKLNQRFVFNNPNITEQCGCGESFKVD